MLKETTVHEDERDCVVPENKSNDTNQDPDEEDNTSVDSTVLAETVNNPDNQQPNSLESGQLTPLASQPTDTSRKLTSKLVLKCPILCA